MTWKVSSVDEFDEWFDQQPEDLQEDILAHVELLETIGPPLSRPKSDTVKGSKYNNLKELRVQHDRDPWRIFYIFDPTRQAVLLVGGNKKGKDEGRWYPEMIRIAEERYDRHLQQLRKNNG